MPDLLPTAAANPPTSLVADSATVPAEAPLVVDARRLARLLCCGVRTIRTWDAAGKLPVPLRISGRVVWRAQEIRAWLDAGAPDRETWAAICAARK